MDLQAWVSIGTLVVAITLFISRWIPLEATALSIPVVLAVTGTLAPAECLSGFSNQAVIAIACIFVLGAGLQEAGVATLVARGLERLGGRSTTRTVFVVMLAAAGLSAFMSNTAAVAVLLPAVAVLSRRTGQVPARLLMPLSFAAILGGTLTIVGTTPNLILGNELRLRTGEGLGVFDFTPVGGAMTAAGIAFMALAGWRLLPRVDPRERAGRAPEPEELAKSYGLASKLHRMRILPASGFGGRTIAEAGVGSEYGLDVILVLRPAAVGRRSLHPRPDLTLQSGDDFYVEGRSEDAERMAEEESLGLDSVAPSEIERVLQRGVTLAEVTLSPRCRVFGRTVKDLQFRQRYGLSVVAVWRGDRVISTGTADLPLQLGDTFLVSGLPLRVRKLAQNPDFLLLGDRPVGSEDVRRAPLAVLLLIAAILPPLLGWLPLAVSALAAAVLMVLTRCVSLEQANRSLDFTVLFLLIGTIPLGIALDRSGVAAGAAQAILAAHDGLGEAGLLGSLFVLSAILSTTSNNGAAAVILAPVAAEAVAAAGGDLGRAFLAVAFGASCAFMLPFAHQCNLMVTGPAGYSTRDFARVGGILSLIVTLTAVALLGA